MMDEHPGEPKLTPSETAESEELEIFERSAVERGPSKAAPRGDEEDPREEEGWTQPESSAQKGAVRDES